MIPTLESKWGYYKNFFEDYIRRTPQYEYTDYWKFIEKIFELTICRYSTSYNIKEMSYLGEQKLGHTVIYLIPRRIDNPKETDYIWVPLIYENSIDKLECSDEPSLFQIGTPGLGLPTEEQVQKYMTIAFYILNKFRRLA